MAILLKEIGSFYIGGHQITISGKPVYKRQFVKGGPIREVDPNGDFERRDGQKIKHELLIVMEQPELHLHPRFQARF